SRPPGRYLRSTYRSNRPNPGNGVPRKSPDHLMWSSENDPIDKLDFVYVYRIQPRLCTSQMPLMHRNDFSCSTLNSMLPSISEPSIWISCSSCIPFSIT